MFSQNYSKPKEEKNDFGSPFVVSFSYIQAAQDPNWSFYMHTHENTLEISYVLNGKGVVYCDDRLYEVKPGSIVMKNPKIRHAERTDCDDPLEQVCINIEGFQLPGEKKNVIPQAETFPVAAAGEMKPFLDALFREMIRNAMSKEKTDPAYLGMLLRSALAAICRCCRQIDDNTERDHHGRLMREVRLYINEHFREGLTLESIADQFHVSIFYLSRQFRKYTGFTVNQYITSCRIGEAQKQFLFQDGADGTVEEVAKQCGYDNLSYFYTVFHKKVGCTPKEYIRRYCH